MNHRERLREAWLNSPGEPLCLMLDQKVAILIIGPSDGAVARDDWRFGFQVPREQDIRWRQPEQLQIINSCWVEVSP